MTKFKIRKPYSYWIDRLAAEEKVIVNNGVDGIHLAKKIKACLPAGTILCESVGHNRFFLKAMMRRPKKMYELKNWAIYDV